MPGSGHFKTTYQADAAVFDTPTKRAAIGVILALFLILPFFLPRYYLHLMNTVMIAAIGALMLNFLVGSARMISFGHSAFMASGAFTAAILSNMFGVPFFACIAAAGVVGALLGTLAGLPAIRLKGTYLVLSTIAIHYVVTVAAALYQAKVGFTAGLALPSPKIFSFTFDSSFRWYFVLFAAVIIVTAAVLNIERTYLGRTWRAIGSRDIAAHALGINVAYYKVLAFTFTSAVTAMAGALSAYYMNYVSIDEYTLWLSITYLAMVIVGGAGSVLGSFFGAFFITLLPYLISGAVDMLKLPPQMSYVRYAVQWAFFGLLILVFLIIEPEGLVGIWKKIRNYFEQWPLKYFKPPNTVR